MEALDFFENEMPKLIQLVGCRLPNDVTFAFILDGPSGGSWQIRRQGRDVAVGPVDKKPKDCQLRCTTTVFRQIVAGLLNPKRAFLDGRLSLQGDLGLALCLQEVLVA